MTASACRLLLATLCLLLVGRAPALHPKLMSAAAASSSDTPDVYRVRRQQQPPPQPNRSQQSVLLRQLMPTLEEINRNVRSLENKLMRHEFRETQVAEFTTKTLNSLSGDHSQTTTALTDMAKQMAAVEERVMTVLTLVATSDERQRLMIGKISEGLDRLLLASAEPSLGRSPNAMPEFPPGAALAVQGSPEMEREVKNIMRKIVELDGNQDSRIRSVSSEVRQLNDALGLHMGHLTSRQDNILNAVEACAQKENEIVTSGESESCRRLESEVVGRLERLTQMQQNQDNLMLQLKEDADKSVSEQKAGIHALLSEMRKESSNFNGSFSAILEGLHGLEEVSRQNLGTLHSNLKAVMDENNDMIKQRIESMEESVKEGQTNIMGAVEDSASMTDNLQSTVSDNYELLSNEISGLNKIEQVMINTADAVLDTKRSIEFGIQQIILELSEIVSQSGRNINSTLSDQISAISFNILKNQTSALTNMTQRMEGEISQVWRQIGIMYQQVEQSINMLDNLQDTTDQHMNVSLRRVGDMDGTVGEINGKVAGVEDNLNYLLGRLTLVLSEFNHMKVGVGHELDKLREMAQEVRIPNGDQDSLKYNINRKRHIIDHY